MNKDYIFVFETNVTKLSWIIDNSHVTQPHSGATGIIKVREHNKLLIEQTNDKIFDASALIINDHVITPVSLFYDTCVLLSDIDGKKPYYEEYIFIFKNALDKNNLKWIEDIINPVSEFDPIKKGHITQLNSGATGIIRNIERNKILVEKIDNGVDFTCNNDTLTVGDGVKSGQDELTPIHTVSGRSRCSKYPRITGSNFGKWEDGVTIEEAIVYAMSVYDTYFMEVHRSLIEIGDDNLLISIPQKHQITLNDGCTLRDKFNDVLSEVLVHKNGRWDREINLITGESSLSHEMKSEFIKFR